MRSKVIIKKFIFQFFIGRIWRKKLFNLTKIQRFINRREKLNGQWIIPNALDKEIWSSFWRNIKKLKRRFTRTKYDIKPTEKGQKCDRCRIFFQVFTWINQNWDITKALIIRYCFFFSKHISNAVHTFLGKYLNS